MFSLNQFQTLFAYHFHTTRRLMDCAARLSEADYRAHPGYGHGSVHDLLFHLLRTDNGWRRGLETGARQAPLDPEAFGDLDGLRLGYEEEERAFEALLIRLGGEGIEATHHLISPRGEMAIPRWRILEHLVLHGMQHHAEIAALLTANGESPGDIDFIFYDGPPA